MIATLLTTAAFELVAKLAPALLPRVFSDDTGAVASAVLDTVAAAVGVPTPKLEQTATRAAVIQQLESNPEKMLSLQADLAKLAVEREAAERSALIEEMRIRSKDYRQEIASEDWFVRRARPAGVWIGQITTAVFVLGLPVTAVFDREAFEALLESLPLIVPLLFGAQGYSAYYANKRSEDKAIGAATDGLMNRGVDALPF